MEYFGKMVGAVIDILKLDITIYGHTFSFWGVFLWSLAALIVLAFIRRAFDA